MSPNTPIYHKYRWSKVYESQEEELIRLLQARGLTGERREANAFDYQDYQATARTTLWCAEGSLTVALGGNYVSLQPGDYLVFNAPADCGLEAGISGYACYITC